MKFTSTTSLVTILALNPAIQARPSKAISASRLAELERRHAEILGIQNGTHHDAAIEKPAVQVLIAGGYLIAAFAEGSISFGSLVNALRLGLNGQETPWNSGSNCLAKFQTHDGVSEYAVALALCMH